MSLPVRGFSLFLSRISVNGSDTFAVLHYEGAPDAEPTSSQIFASGPVQFEEFQMAVGPDFEWLSIFLTLYTTSLWLTLVLPVETLQLITPSTLRSLLPRRTVMSGSVNLHSQFHIEPRCWILFRPSMVFNISLPAFLPCSTSLPTQLSKCFLIVFFPRHSTSFSPVFNTSENTFTLPPNATIEVAFIGGAGHAFHLQWVLYLWYQWPTLNSLNLFPSSGHTFDVIQSASGGPVNFVNPPRRDTVASGGTTANPLRIRFRTDNPGTSSPVYPPLVTHRNIRSLVYSLPSWLALGSWSRGRFCRGPDWYVIMFNLGL